MSEPTPSAAVEGPLACPFCGSEGKAVTDSSGHWHWVICSSDPKDAMLIGCDDTAAKAIARWNTRAVDLRVAGLSEQLAVSRSDFTIMSEAFNELEQERDEANRLAAAWEASAAQFCRNECFYRDLIIKIGEPFGIAAKTSDDGSIQQDVLALKVPELVEAMRQERDALEQKRDEALKWKNEDPRMLREQIRVGDVAFNGLTERHNTLTSEFDALATTSKAVIAGLERQIADLKLELRMKEANP